MPPHLPALRGGRLRCRRFTSHVPFLSHCQVITTGALIMELAAVGVLGATVLVYDYFANRDAGY
jgi:hypothetical protein